MERPSQTLGLLRHVLLLALADLIPIVVSALLLVSTPAFAQLTAAPSASPPPESIAPPLRAQLAPSGHKVAVGTASIELWWASTLAAGANGWTEVREGTLVGAMRVTGPFREIRGKTVSPGDYTLRFALQPQNGDHLGASPYREYLLISPAAADTDPKPLGFDGVVAIAKQTTGTSHPAALSLDPPLSTGAPHSTYSTELDLKGVVFELKTAAGATLKFGLILLGVIEH